MTDETTTEQLAEIEGQQADTPTTEYTPPEGWRVLAVGERLRAGDMIVRKDGSRYPAERFGGWVGSNQRHIRLIEPQPQPQPQPEPQPVPVPVQVREGRWRTRGGDIKTIRQCEPLKGAYYVWRWTDGFMTFRDNGRHLGFQESVNDLVAYLGPIEQQPEPQAQSQPVSDADQQIRLLEQANHNLAGTIGRLQARSNELEKLVTDLRTINESQEKAVRAAGRQNTDLQHRLDVVSAEWAEQAGTINGLRAHVEAVEADVVQQRLERNRYQNQVLRLTAELDNKTTECRNLRIELDALQQAPQAETVAALPTSTEDRFEEGWNQGTARAVETIAEWLEPIKGAIDAADNVAETERAGNLAADIIRALPAIMRSLTGLTPED